MADVAPCQQKLSLKTTQNTKTNDKWYKSWGKKTIL